MRVMRSGRVLLLIVIVSATGALVLWKAMHSNENSKPTSACSTQLVQEQSNPQPISLPAPRVNEKEILPEPPKKSTAESTSTKVQPHPETERRSAMHESRQLLEAARVAARAGDVARLRQIVEQGRQDPDTDNAHWLVAYRLVLGCFESMNAQTQAAGAQFVRDQSGSPLRREVRRYCQVSDETMNLN